MYHIDFFERSDGSTPFQEYIDVMKEKMRAKTLRSLQLLREFGPELREPNTKPLGDGIFELRTILGSDAGRTLFFFFDGQTIVITHGFIKKTQKTPSREIERAKKYRSEYMNRKQSAS